MEEAKQNLVFRKKHTELGENKTWFQPKPVAQLASWMC